MKNLLALLGLYFLITVVFRIDLTRFLGYLKLPGFNLPGNQQQQQVQQPQDSQTLLQVPQVQQTPQIPQAVQTPQATPKSQWGLGIRGGITTPFGSTKNEINLGNPDFNENGNERSE